MDGMSLLLLCVPQKTGPDKYCALLWILFWRKNYCLCHPKNKWINKQKKKKNCFMGRRTCQVGSVRRVFFFWFFGGFFWFFFVFLFLFFVFSGSKNEPWNTIFFKYTFFAEKFWENILIYFQKFSAKMFRFWSKNGWFYKILEKF